MKRRRLALVAIALFGVVAWLMWPRPSAVIAAAKEKYARLQLGMSEAEVTAILTMCSSGDHIVSAATLYGGTHTLLGVNLADTTLPRAALAGADLRRACLRHVAMWEADLSGADLRGADLSDVTGLTSGQLVSVIKDERTKLPELMR